MTLESPKQLRFEDMCKYWYSDSSFLHQLSLDELLKLHKKFNFTPKSPLRLNKLSAVNSKAPYSLKDKKL